MGEYLLLEGLALGIAFGLGFLAAKAKYHRTEKVKIPDYVPTDWKIGKGDG